MLSQKVLLDIIEKKNYIKFEDSLKKGLILDSYEIFLLLISKGDLKFLNLLLKYNFDFSTLDNMPFFFACKSNKLDIINFFANNEQVKLEQNYYSHFAAIGHSLNLTSFETLFKKYNLNNEKFILTSLSYACKNLNFEVVKFLLEQKELTDSESFYEIYESSISMNNIELLKIFSEDSFKRLKSKKFKLKNPLKVACLDGDREVFDYFLNNVNYNVSKNKNEALIVSASYGYFYFVDSILKHKKFNDKYFNVNTISAAVISGDVNILNLLLNHPKNTQILNLNECSESLLKYSDNGLDVLKILLNDKRFDPTYKNNYLILELFKEKKINHCYLLFKNKKVKELLKKQSTEIYNTLNIKSVSSDF